MPDQKASRPAPRTVLTVFCNAAFTICLLALLGSLRRGLLLVVASGASLVAELELLIAVASLSAEHELSGSDSQALEHGLSTCSPWAQ